MVDWEAISVALLASFGSIIIRFMSESRLQRLNLAYWEFKMWLFPKRKYIWACTGSKKATEKEYGCPSFWVCSEQQHRLMLAKTKTYNCVWCRAPMIYHRVAKGSMMVQLDELATSTVPATPQKPPKDSDRVALLL